jgi:glycosyltransferase involved in cell wall biosynthesis
MSKRVCVWFLVTDLNNYGGAPRINHDVMVGLNRERFEAIQVIVYQLGELGQSARDLGVRTFCGLAKSRTNVLVLWRLWRLAKKFPPDVVFTTENAFALFYGSLMKRLGMARAHVAALHTARFINWQAERAWKFALPRCDRIIALSEQNRQYWQERTGLPLERFTIIYNGVDMKRFHPPEDKTQVRRELHLPTDRPIVGTLANFNPVKNLPLFVDVAGELLGQGRGVHFVMAGGGPELEAIRSYVHSKGLQEHFCLPGLVRDPAPWHQALDVEMLTSHSEALPLAAIEALACGVPFVATDVGGVRDVVRDGVNGFVVPPGDRSALVERVSTVLDDRDCYARLASAARPSVEREFSVEAMVGRYEAVFQEVAAQRPEMGARDAS